MKKKSTLILLSKIKGMTTIVFLSVGFTVEQ